MTGHKQALLTSSQEHYLKKYLLGALVHAEVDRLQKNPHQTLPNLGGPFDLKDEHAVSATPFLRYLFEAVVVHFPFLASTSGELWPKLQTFMEEWAKIDSGNGVEREEMNRRKRLKRKGEKTIVLLYSMAIKSAEQRALEKKRLAGLAGLAGKDPSAGDLERLQLNEQLPTPAQTPPPGSNSVHGVSINVVGIRIVHEKRHVREHEHAEFIVSSTLSNGKEYFVARRHSAFRRLYATLRQEFPQHEFPLPPAKYTAKSGSSGAKAAREKDRISLRGYLHSLARTAPEVVSSSLFTSFLSKDAMVLTQEEMKDVRVHAALDEHRMAQQQKFDEEVAKKVKELDTHMREVKQDILQPGGLTRLFKAFKSIDNVKDLPPLYQTVFEWGCMNFASTLYHLFTSSDDATLNYTQLKRTHLLLPYRTMWGILKVSNPMAMMKGIVDLFLAQPFGRRSLMQRIISVNVQDEITEYKKEISRLEASVGDAGLCAKIHNYVYAPKAAVDSIFSGDEPYDITDLRLVMDVLKSDQIMPVLQPAQIERVWLAQQKMEKDELEKDRLHIQQQQFLGGDVSGQSDDDSDTTTENSKGNEESSGSGRRFYRSKKDTKHYDEMNLIRLLQQLLVTHLRIRDKERVLDIVFQGVTGEIFKELISIFYQPLVQVYKSANVADSLMDIKDFVDELLKIVEQVDENEEGAHGKPSTATLYLDLVKKHLPQFYTFVHSVHKQEGGLFHDLLEWIESIITFMRTGFARTRINYKTGEELRLTVDLKGLVQTHVDKDQWEEVRKEAEELCLYFGEVKDRKREEVRHMAGLDRAGNGAQVGLDDEQQRRDQERIARELREMGMEQEDVDELEMINYENHGRHDGEDEGEHGLTLPKVPIIDTLKGPFIQMMDQALFQTARQE